MTMHLNGKKHLKKEKNHIFKMMQGEISDGKGKLCTVYLDQIQILFINNKMIIFLFLQRNLKQPKVTVTTFYLIIWIY